MARSNRVFKRTYNMCLDRIAISQALGSVSDLARVNDVSRNTARRVLIALKQRCLGDGACAARHRLLSTA
jgi:hypothetical protein